MHFIKPLGMPLILHGDDACPVFEVTLSETDRTLTITEFSGLPLQAECADGDAAVIEVHAEKVVISLAKEDEEPS